MICNNPASAAYSRTEHDALGEVTLPAGALYGVQSARAAENFGFSSHSFARERYYVAALGTIKAAAASANLALGLLEPGIARAVIDAALELRDGRLDSHLIVDELEGSGGTSTNMNVNEVVANRALQLLGRQTGDYSTVHPNDAVNRSQSTNDVIPTAIKIGCHGALIPLLDELALLTAAFDQRAQDFATHLRLGRTCLQDAQPMTLGQAFGAHVAVLERLGNNLRARQEELLDLPIGATAIGTGFGAPPGYRAAVIEGLRELTGAQWRSAGNLFDGLANADVYARLSAELRGLALTLGKIGNDFQILSSGPNGGLGELHLPEVQAGSSIMPGKVNPVLPMAMCQIGFAVAGYDSIIAQACQQGQLEINPYEPVIAAHLFSQIRLLTAGCNRFRRFCIEGLGADCGRMEANLYRSSAVATALLPSMGYSDVSRIVREAQASGESFIEAAERLGLLSPALAREMTLRSAGLNASED